MARSLAGDDPLGQSGGRATVRLVQVGEPILEPADDHPHADDALLGPIIPFDILPLGHEPARHDVPSCLDRGPFKSLVFDPDPKLFKDRGRDRRRVLDHLGRGKYVCVPLDHILLRSSRQELDGSVFIAGHAPIVEKALRHPTGEPEFDSYVA